MFPYQTNPGIWSPGDYRALTSCAERLPPPIIVDRLDTGQTPPDTAWTAIYFRIVGFSSHITFTKAVTEFGPWHSYWSPMIGQGEECCTLSEALDEGTMRLLAALGGARREAA